LDVGGPSLEGVAALFIVVVLHRATQNCFFFGLVLALPTCARATSFIAFGVMFQVLNSSVEFMLLLELLCCYGNLLTAMSNAAELISSK
jgi:hypothetical protein